MVKTFYNFVKAQIIMQMLFDFCLMFEKTYDTLAAVSSSSASLIGDHAGRNS